MASSPPDLLVNFITALGGGLGGGLVTGAVAYWQTRHMLSQEREKAAEERQQQAEEVRQQREDQALQELLPVLAEIKSRLGSYKVFAALTMASDHRPSPQEEVKANLKTGSEVCLPRIATPEVRDRYRKLVEYMVEYRGLEIPRRPDSHGNLGAGKEMHPGYGDRVKADIAEWINYVRETIEARLQHRPMPPDVDMPPTLSRIDLPAWQRPALPEEEPSAPAPPTQQPWWKFWRR